MSIVEQLSRLARHVAEKATEKNTPFAETLDAFGKLTTYYGMVQKHKGKSDDAGADESNFGTFQSKLNEVEAQENPNGRASRISGRRG